MQRSHTPLNALCYDMCYGCLAPVSVAQNEGAQNTMATIYERRSAKFGMRYTVRAAVRGYAPRVRTFNTRKEATEWGDAQEREMLTLKKEQGIGHDFASYTIAGLIRDFLKEPKTKAQRSLDDTSRRLCWFVDKHAATKIMDVSARLLRKWREELAQDKGPATTNRYMSVLRSAWNFGHPGRGASGQQAVAQGFDAARAERARALLEQRGGREAVKGG